MAVIRRTVSVTNKRIGVNNFDTGADQVGLAIADNRSSDLSEWDRSVLEELTIDHVLPRYLGGVSSWENCTTACKTCNWNKGNKLQRPKNKPTTPSYHELNHKYKNIPLHISDPAWKTYISWPDELIFVKNKAA